MRRRNRVSNSKRDGGTGQDRVTCNPAQTGDFLARIAGDVSAQTVADDVNLIGQHPELFLRPENAFFDHVETGVPDSHTDDCNADPST